MKPGRWAGVAPRGLVVAVLVLLSAVAALVGVSCALFVWPSTDAPRAADALVVLGPGRHGERLEKARSLLGRGIAPVVVVSRSRRPGRWPLEDRLCARKGSICFRSRPFTTRGEARIVGRLAAERRWHTLVLVTSTYHVTRARLLYGRCFDGQIRVVAADPRAGPRALVELVAHEWGGLLDAVLVERSC
jgi:uncharacterized SAM-binding protein YcdF (DUF218 family)